ncbi:MAG: DUF1501 domain-containing protein [Verrucomicrobia bacterium]|jgi:hypothetical protein|nr:DUF1501 domain-containing protein [Verrucomicrobiota bacterium]
MSIERYMLSRRDWLARAGLGCGAMALQQMLVGSAGATEVQPHFPPTAKRVIWLFMHGGPSQMDTFDPKPELNKRHGQQPPASMHDLKLQFTDVRSQKLMGSDFAFSRCGDSGIEISDGFTHLQRHADDMAVIRSCHHEVFNHTPAIWLMNTGHDRMGRPSMGSWLSYGLGSETDNLPGFVVMNDGALKPGTGVWGSGFLSARHQGTKLNMSGPPITNLTARGDGQRDMLDYVQKLNAMHKVKRPADSELEARIQSYELAYRMQMAAPEAVDISREPQATRELYGKGFGEQCLTARRLVERGVRMVQIYNGCGSGNEWDTHSNNNQLHKKLIAGVDRGCAALLTDLKRRGMLDDTLVIWSGEFGRTPTTEGGSGRDHNPYGFSCWMAGGGVMGGQVIGATDELGFRAVEDPLHVHDLHATVLKLMGVQHDLLSVRHKGLDMRLTDLFGYDDIVDRLTGG